jgi:hypothetical protein
MVSSYYGRGMKIFPDARPHVELMIFKVQMAGGKNLELVSPFALSHLNKLIL